MRLQIERIGGYRSVQYLTAPGPAEEGRDRQQQTQGHASLLPSANALHSQGVRVRGGSAPGTGGEAAPRQNITTKYTKSTKLAPVVKMLLHITT